MNWVLTKTSGEGVGDEARGGREHLLQWKAGSIQLREIFDSRDGDVGTQSSPEWSSR